MSEPIRTLRIDNTHRVKVYVDEDAQNPRTDRDMQTGALSVRGDSRRMNVTPVHSFPGDLRDADQRLYGATTSWVDEVNVVRWARIFYGIELVYDDGTYWWVNPEALDAWTPVGEFAGQQLYRYGAGTELITRQQLELRIIQAEREEYECWANGNVVGLAIEYYFQSATVNFGVNENDELILLADEADELLELGVDESKWAEQDSVWGFYVDAWDDAVVIDEAKGLF